MTPGTVGPNRFDLTLSDYDTGQPLTASSVRLRFRPTAAGTRTAELVVHLNPGDITRRVRISGTAVDSGPIPTPSCAA